MATDGGLTDGQEELFDEDFDPIALLEGMEREHQGNAAPLDFLARSQQARFQSAAAAKVSLRAQDCIGSEGQCCGWVSYVLHKIPGFKQGAGGRGGKSARARQLFGASIDDIWCALIPNISPQVFISFASACRYHAHAIVQCDIVLFCRDEELAEEIGMGNSKRRRRSKQRRRRAVARGVRSRKLPEEVNRLLGEANLLYATSR